MEVSWDEWLDGKLMEVEESIFSVDDEMKCIHMNPPPKVPSFGHGFGHGGHGFGLARRRAIQTPSVPKATERAAPPRPGVLEQWNGGDRGAMGRPFR